MSNTQIPPNKRGIKGKSLEPDNKNKGTKSPKVSSTAKCYKCQGYGHLAVSYPSLVKITIIDETPTEATESDSEEYIYDPGDVETDEEPTSDDVGLNCINQTLQTHFFVVSCVPSQPTEKNNWRKSATFHKLQVHKFTKIENKNWKVIMDCGSYINAISSKSLENLRFEVVPHPTHSRCHTLTPQHLRSDNDVLSQSNSIIIKTRSGVM